MRISARVSLFLGDIGSFSYWFSFTSLAIAPQVSIFTYLPKLSLFILQLSRVGPTFFISLTSIPPLLSHLVYLVALQLGTGKRRYAGVRSNASNSNPTSQSYTAPPSSFLFLWFHCENPDFSGIKIFAHLFSPASHVESLQNYTNPAIKDKLFLKFKIPLNFFFKGLLRSSLKFFQSVFN